MRSWTRGRQWQLWGQERTEPYCWASAWSFSLSWCTSSWESPYCALTLTGSNNDLQTFSVWKPEMNILFYVISFRLIQNLCSHVFSYPLKTLQICLQHTLRISALSLQCLDGCGKLHYTKLHHHVGCKLLIQLWSRVLEKLPLPLSPGLYQPQLLRKGDATVAQWGDTGQQLWGILQLIVLLLILFPLSCIWPWWRGFSFIIIIL